MTDADVYSPDDYLVTIDAEPPEVFIVRGTLVDFVPLEHGMPSSADEPY